MKAAAIAVLVFAALVGAVCSLLIPMAWVPVLGALCFLLAFFTPLNLWRNSRGRLARFLCALIALFFACAGVFIALNFAAQAVVFARQGGALWFAAAAMGCTALVGLIFTGVFGYFVPRLFDRALWRAGVHVAMLAAAVGAQVDFSFGQHLPLVLPPDAQTAVTEMVNDHGDILPLGFRFRMDGVEQGTAHCHIERLHKERTETVEQVLRVGDSYSSKGWTLSFTGVTDGEATFRADYAPARVLQYAGLLGMLLCLGGAFATRKQG